MLLDFSHLHVCCVRVHVCGFPCNIECVIIGNESRSQDWAARCGKHLSVCHEQKCRGGYLGACKEKDGINIV